MPPSGLAARQRGALFTSARSSLAVQSAEVLTPSGENVMVRLTVRLVAVFLPVGHAQSAQSAQPVSQPSSEGRSPKSAGLL